MTFTRSKWQVLGGTERQKAALLAAWFFLTVATLWVLKPVRSASLIAHLGTGELPYVRLATVVAVLLVVAGYSRIVDGLPRVRIARGAYLLFAAVLVLFWAALLLGGETLGAQRWFVWLVFILVDIYSTVMIGIFWTYTNDVVSTAQADRLYGPIGIGGTIGGIVGGASVDSLVRLTGPVHLLLFSAGLCVASAALVWRSERVLHPHPRVVAPTKHGLAAATQGLTEVMRSRYLLLLVGVVVSYEFAAAMTDFVINVVFERSFPTEVQLAQMFGRLGWIVSATALISQVVLVPLVLPYKRAALLVPPVAMLAATVGLALIPVVGMAIVLSTADRGLNYSLQQATKETLYVPLTDVQKYKAKAVIDMFIDRFGKAISAVALIVATSVAGLSIAVLLAIAAVAMLVWIWSADGLGRRYAVPVADHVDDAA
jgi:AAA family ATP:ADP antiporter